MSGARFKNRPISGVVFDKDGTLFDFRATWTAWAQQYLSDLAQGDPARARHLGAVIGFDVVSGEYHPESPVIAGSAIEIAELLLPHVPGQNLDELLVHMNSAAANAPMVAAAPLDPTLCALKGLGVKLGVATNDAEYPAKVHLEAAGVVQHFDFIAGYDSGFGAKPEAGQLLGFAKATGCAPSECLMVGDSLHDLTAGKAAGMGTVAVLTGMAVREDLQDFADVVLDHIGQLPELLTPSQDSGIVNT